MNESHHTHEGDVQAALETALRLHGVEIRHIGPGDVAHEGAPIAIVPKGMQVQSIKPLLDEYLLRPERTRGTAELQTARSLIDHANRFKTEDSALFALHLRGQATLTAVYDYDSAAGPDNCEHRARYAFPMSREWLAWGRANGSKLSLAEFAELLEDRIEDVLDPSTLKADAAAKEFAQRLGYDLASPSQLITLSRGLQVNVDSKVANHKQLSSGEAQLIFKEEHTDADGAPLKVPGGFVVAIPVFEGGPAYQLPVRLRYRVSRSNGSITWECHLSRVADVFRHAFEEACTKAAEETGLPLFYGAPE